MTVISLLYTETTLTIFHILRQSVHFIYLKLSETSFLTYRLQLDCRNVHSDLLLHDELYRLSQSSLGTLLDISLPSPLILLWRSTRNSLW